MIVKTLTITCYLILFTIIIQGQGLTDQNIKNTPIDYYVQVKQFGEFIERFNYKIDWYGKPIDSIFQKKISRKLYLQVLFDIEDPRFQNNLDSSYYSLQQKFIEYVTKETASQKISLYSIPIIAEANTNIFYEGRNHKIIVYLTPEVLKDRSLKWTLCKVDASCFTSISDSLINYFIAPNSHETNFINLKRISKVPNPLYFCNSSLTTDATLIFITEVAEKRLTVLNVEKIKYHIIFPEWICSVEEFNRKTLNSGWLISNVLKKKTTLAEFLQAR